MRTVMTRILWYLGLVLVAMGFSRISNFRISEAFCPAVGVYISASLLWLFFGKLFIEPGDDSRDVFGIRNNKFWAILLLGGGALSVLLLCIDQTLAASFAITVALSGADELLKLRSDKAERA